MKDIVLKISDKLNKFAEYLMIGLMTGISLLIFTQVVFRYVFNYSLFWSEELARYTLIWITFIGASVGFKKKGHIGVDFLYNRFSLQTQKNLTVFSDFIILILSLILTVYGANLSKFVHMQSSAALLIPMSIPYSAIAIGGFFTIFHSLNFLLEDINRLKPGKRS